MNKILIISDDVVASKMAGPAIRDWEYAKALSRYCRVTLAIPNRSDLQPTHFKMVHYDNASSLKALVDESDVVITSGYTLKRFPFLKDIPIPLVINISHSFVLENLQLFAQYEDMAFRLGAYNDNATVLNEQLLAGDFFVCNSERQRDYWLGMLSALGRVNPLTFDMDKSLRKLIDVVPHGLPDEEPEHRKQVLKGVYKCIAPDDKVLIWAGGIYNWLDPLTLIKAMAEIAKRRDDVKLFFAGVKHPSPNVPFLDMSREAERLSQALGLTDKFVFFNDWMPYEERVNYLLEADIGVTLHLEHIETRYALRSRILDYIWTSLPIVTTEGDTTAELVQEYNLGRVVGYQDVEQLVKVLLEMLDTPNLREKYQPNFARVAERFRWQKATAPLVRFCLAPYKAPDRVKEAKPLARFLQITAQRESIWKLRFATAWRCYREKGFLALCGLILHFLRRRLNI